MLLLLSAASGAAALIYEIVWLQLLELIVGSTAVSLGILLATFMGGMCLGSLIFPRLVSVRHDPLKVYAVIEAGIGVCGVLVLLLIPATGTALAVACLIPPTLLMGATLPALARAVHSAGMLYTLNIAGSVFGCLLAGFYLLPQFDTATAVYVAVAINFAAAAFAFTRPRVTAEEEAPTVRPPSAELVYTAIALSGFCALGSEAIWTRVLGLVFGASVYTFSVILAVFLTGLGMGSALGTRLSRVFSPRAALGYAQLLAGAAMAWAAYTMNRSLPFWPDNSSAIWQTFALDLARAAWVVLPATLLWGASFPLALAAAGTGRGTSGVVARIYSANTLGAILGALSASLLLVAWVGSQRSEQLLIAVSAITGLLLIRPATPLRFVAALLTGLSIYSVPPIEPLLITHGRFAASWAGKGDIVFAKEGRNSSVGVTRFPDGVLTFHVAGKIQASNNARDMRLQRMLGHLTTLTAAHPRSVLVIGCGAGVTAGAVSMDPLVEHETIVEIEPLVPQAATAYFQDANFEVLQNPKVQLRIDDGRHFLLTTEERFDGITIDPLDPWVKGAASLYTKEFYEVMKRHLNPGGTVTMYIQLFETTSPAVKSALATFFEVFPRATIWGNPYNGQGHDMVLLGQAEALRIDLDQMEQRVDYRGDSPLARSLTEAGFQSPVDLFATYTGRAADLAQWAQGAAINRDRNLRMQYLAGLGLNRDDSAAIYGTLLAHRRFPDEVFQSTQGRADSLRAAIRRTP